MLKKKEFEEELLPQGLLTPNNYLLEILSPEQGQVVGFLWFAAEERNGQRVAFIYDIQVLDAYRRQGHATRALTALGSALQTAWAKQALAE